MDTELVKGNEKAAKGNEKAVEGNEKAEEGSSKRAGSNLEQEDAKRWRLEEENEFVELKRCLEIIPEDDDDVTIEATPISSKSPTIVDYKIYKERKKSYFKIIRADVCQEVMKMFDEKNPASNNGVVPGFMHHVGPYKDKIDPKGMRCVLIGYPPRQKGYKLYNLSSHEVFHSRDVVFQENVFPFREHAPSSTPSPINSIHYPEFTTDEELEVLVNTAGHFMVVLVYVDDVLVTGDSIHKITQVKEALDQTFTIKDIGEAEYFLGNKSHEKKQPTVPDLPLKPNTGVWQLLLVNYFG
nr:integrase, catalytic core [Tanacetum cinerariifolium]